MVLLDRGSRWPPRPAAAQGFKPSKPVEFVVHTGPGGGNDVLARFIATAMEKEKLLPVRLQVANKPGGGGLTALAYLAEKRGDPHTIGTFTGVWITNSLMRAEAKVTVKDVTPVVRLALEPAVIVVKQRRALQDAQGLHRRRQGGARPAQAVGRLHRQPRLGRPPAAQQAHRRAVGVHLLPGRRRAHRGAAGRPRADDGDRAAGGGGAHPRRQHARAGPDRRPAPAGLPRCPDAQRGGLRRPHRAGGARRGRAAGGAPEVVAYWEDAFARLAQTATWKKYLEDNQFEDGFQKARSSEVRSTATPRRCAAILGTPASTSCADRARLPPASRPDRAATPGAASGDRARP